MKLEEGMYVRTKWGIAKYIHKLVTRETIRYVIDKKIVYDNVEDWEDVLLSNEILKASHNIIDLIEKNDFVNSKRVTDKIGKYIYLEDEIRVSNTQIKSIVTKEQFESMSYKIGE